MKIFGYSIYKVKGKYKVAQDLMDLLTQNRIIIDKKWEKIFNEIYLISPQKTK